MQWCQRPGHYRLLEVDLQFCEENQLQQFFPGRGLGPRGVLTAGGQVQHAVNPLSLDSRRHPSIPAAPRSAGTTIQRLR